MIATAKIIFNLINLHRPFCIRTHENPIERMDDKLMNILASEITTINFPNCDYLDVSAYNEINQDADFVYRWG